METIEEYYERYITWLQEQEVTSIEIINTIRAVREKLRQLKNDK